MRPHTLLTPQTRPQAHPRRTQARFRYPRHTSCTFRQHLKPRCSHTSQTTHQPSVLSPAVHQSIRLPFVSSASVPRAFLMRSIRVDLSVFSSVAVRFLGSWLGSLPLEIRSLVFRWRWLKTDLGVEFLGGRFRALPGVSGRFERLGCRHLLVRAADLNALCARFFLSVVRVCLYGLQRLRVVLRAF